MSTKVFITKHLTKGKYSGTPLTDRIVIFHVETKVYARTTN